MKTIADIIKYVKNYMTDESFMCADLPCNCCIKEHWCFYQTCFLALDYLYNGEF